jgi:hypothetical protein
MLTILSLNSEPLPAVASSGQAAGLNSCFPAREKLHRKVFAGWQHVWYDNIVQHLRRVCAMRGISH